MKGLLAGAVSGALVAGVVGVLLAPGTPPVGQAASPGPPAGVAGASGACQTPMPDLSAEQSAVARRGVAAADRAGLGDLGARIIIATGLVESELRDLDHGDRDSIGWLQQRPSQGWSNAGDVDAGADDFFARLEATAGWRQMDPGLAAQAVQRSAHPGRYGARMGQATAIVASIRGTPCETVAQAVDTAKCPPTGRPAESGLQPTTLLAMRCGAAQFPVVTSFSGRSGRPNASDHPAGRAVDFMIPRWQTPDGKATGWEVARWFEANASRLGVTYLIWDAKIWRARTGEWTTYRHPNGSTDPTSMHLDHVHVSTR